MRTLFALALLCGLLSGAFADTAPAPADVADAPTAGVSQFVFERGGLHVPVRYDVPEGLAPDAPVVFVMHGVKRNADTYLDEWASYAARYHFLLVVPEFSESEFPGARGYQDGNLVTAGGQPIPRERWTYGMIEPIFDEVRRRTGNASERYSIYGHSAGAQFVNRFVAFVPQARLARAISANAGSYLLPAAAQEFPFGFARSGLGEDDRRAFLGRPLTVLLGTADIDPHHPELSHAPGAEAQGPFRLARGNYFYECGRKAADDLGVPLGWTISFAPGVAHSDKEMAPFAVKCLLAP